MKPAKRCCESRDHCAHSVYAVMLSSRWVSGWKPGCLFWRFFNSGIDRNGMIKSWFDLVCTCQPWYPALISKRNLNWFQNRPIMNFLSFLSFLFRSRSSHWTEIKWAKSQSNGPVLHVKFSPMPISLESISQWIWMFAWKQLCWELAF